MREMKVTVNNNNFRLSQVHVVSRFSKLVLCNFYLVSFTITMHYAVELDTVRQCASFVNSKFVIWTIGSAEKNLFHINLHDMTIRTSTTSDLPDHVNHSATHYLLASHEVSADSQWYWLSLFLWLFLYTV